MKTFGAMLLVLVVSVWTTSAVHAYELDSNTVGYADYGGASYFRDKCYTAGVANKLNRIMVTISTNNGVVKSYEAGCWGGGSAPERGYYVFPGSKWDLWCGNGNYAIDGLYGYSDQGGVLGVGIACNNGSSSVKGRFAGVNGPYYNSVRCPSGTVAWGLWSSLGASRVGRLGMICNDWWP